MELRSEILEIGRFQTSADACSYLAEETSRLTYRFIPHLSPAAYNELLQRGWRRFGFQFFRPACPSCVKCRSLRVDVDRFSPSKSQRRNLNRNQEVRLVVQAPTATPIHVELFNRYHADMRARRNWRNQAITEDDYETMFVTGGGGTAREFVYLEGDRVIGVGLTDVTQKSSSSVYFYHDPAYRDRGLGVFSLLQEIEFARSQGVQHHYLGYWISECPSMAYKSQYRPHEILTRFPADNEEPLWVEAPVSRD